MVGCGEMMFGFGGYDKPRREYRSLTSLEYNKISEEDRVCGILTRT